MLQNLYFVETHDALLSEAKELKNRPGRLNAVKMGVLIFTYIISAIPTGNPSRSFLGKKTKSDSKIHTTR